MQHLRKLLEEERSSKEAIYKELAAEKIESAKKDKKLDAYRKKYGSEY